MLRAEDNRYDVVVVGARAAGASTAMLLARRGLKVLVVDRARHGSDTLSTLALMRGAVLQLDRWGVREGVVAGGTPALRTTSFHYGDDVIALPIKPRDGVDALYAPRRTVLDAVLVDAAVEAGAEVRFGVRLVDLVRSARGRVDGVILQDHDGNLARVRAGLVIGADGRNSTVARLVGAQKYRVARHATSVVYGFWSGLELEGLHWYFRPGTAAGAIPTNGNETLVFACVPAGRFQSEIRLDVALGHDRVVSECAPWLYSALQSAHKVGKFHGFPGLPGYFRDGWGPGWALVGDAGYFKDPLTAHGITDALRDAEFLARAAVKGSDRALAEYQSVRDELSMGLFEVTDQIASFAWDLDSVQSLHLTLSKEMNRDVSALLELHDGPVVESIPA